MLYSSHIYLDELFAAISWTPSYIRYYLDLLRSGLIELGWAGFKPSFVLSNSGFV